jgi:hypothetical protein
MHKRSTDPAGLFRSYQVVSAHGTTGTYLQQLLVFTTARRKAPEGVIDFVLQCLPAGVQLLAKRTRAPEGVRRAPGGLRSLRGWPQCVEAVR